MSSAARSRSARVTPWRSAASHAAIPGHTPCRRAMSSAVLAGWVTRNPSTRMTCSRPTGAPCVMMPPLVRVARWSTLAMWGGLVRASGTPSRCTIAAESWVKTGSAPTARTTALIRSIGASRKGSAAAYASPSAYTPLRSRTHSPLASRAATSRASSPAARACWCVIRPCWERAGRSSGGPWTERRTDARAARPQAAEPVEGRAPGRPVDDRRPARARATMPVTARTGHSRPHGWGREWCC